MSENLSFIIILEFVAPFAILSIILTLALLNRNKKNKKGLTQLLESVQSGEQDYQKKLVQFLQKSGVDEAKVEDLVQKFSKSRRAFFKQTLTALNNNDIEQINALSGKFSLFSDQYHQLELLSSATAAIPATEEAEVEESTDNNDSNREFEANYKVVKRENKKLKAEVHVSVSALNSLFKEYSSMFGEVSNTSNNMSVQEVLEAMEKITKGDFKPDNIVGDIPPDDEIVIEASTDDDEQPESEVESESSDAETDESKVSEEASQNTTDEKSGENDGQNDVEISEDDVITDDPGDDLADELAQQAESESVAKDTSTIQLDSILDEIEDDQESTEDTTEDVDASWDEAFEETGEEPDAAAMEQVKQAEKNDTEEAKKSDSDAEDEPTAT